MVYPDVTREVAPTAASDRDRHITAFRWMLLARALEDRLAAMYRGGKVKGGMYLGRGQEALSASIGMSLRRKDIFAPLIRDMAGRLAFGEPILEVARTYLGSALGPMRGRDGNIHRGIPKMGYYAMISHLGAMISVVNGGLLARRFKGEAGVVGATSIGEGGTSTGAYHEALNQAAIEKLPLVVIVADNQYAYSTPTSRQFACERLESRAAGYGIAVHSADGPDLTSCLNAVGRAVDAARSGCGPQMVVARLLRLCGHGEHDDASYVDPAMKLDPVGRDCLRVGEKILVERNWATPGAVDGWKKEAAAQVDEAILAAQREPTPDPYREDWSALSEKRLLELHEEQPMPRK